mmetsp:Transcript_40148/g.40678  ORF Transcript_40148/g.40678 Transcript_40148/m.40678 type:complete len:93 (-) Transcript_40148:274-552(-)
MAANSKSMRGAIMEFTSTIHRKSNGEAIFYPTTIVHLKPAPITNITTNFLSTAAQLEDFFQVNKISNTHSYNLVLRNDRHGNTCFYEKNTEA